jgi:hypothetical protein
MVRVGPGCRVMWVVWMRWSYIIRAGGRLAQYATLVAAGAYSLRYSAYFRPPFDQLTFGLCILLLSVGILGLIISIVPGLISKLVASTRKYIWTDLRDQRSRREEAALTIEYFSHQTKKAAKSLAFVVPVASAYSIQAHDLSVFIVGLGYSAVVIVSLALTHYRIKHGYFGSTAAEAAELVEFVTTQASEGSPPNSRKVSTPFLDRVEARVIELEGSAAPEKG